MAVVALMAVAGQQLVAPLVSAKRSPASAPAAEPDFISQDLGSASIATVSLP